MSLYQVEQAGLNPSLKLLQMRKKKQLSEPTFRSIAQRTTDGIVIVDQDGNVRFANPAAEELFGRKAGQLLGAHLGLPLVSGESTDVDIPRNGDLDANFPAYPAFQHLCSARDVPFLTQAGQT